jgi:hypothetical protein
VRATESTGQNTTSGGVFSRAFQEIDLKRNGNESDGDFSPTIAGNTL